MTQWHKVAEIGEIAQGRIKTVAAGGRTVCLSNFEGTHGALDNHCPHQGGPLGEGTIEDSWLRCPWHGYEYHPLTGKPPEGFSDGATAFEVETRDDGVYVGIPTDETPTRTVSDVIVETLVNWGVTHVFGMVGHSNLGFADAMRRAAERGDLTYVGVRHEGAAAFAATAFGKLTGGLAACFAIAGPGSTNMLTGLYDAKVDRAPVLALSGQVPAKALGRGAFQDLDLGAAFADVAAYSTTLMAGSDHAEIACIAAKTALVERDVAHLILPDEIQVQAAPDAEPGSPDGRVGEREIRPPDAALAAASARLAEAKRPVVVVGDGARRQMGPVVALAERLNAPVLTTFKAKGLISDSHPLGAGVLGRSGTPVASWMMNESDLLLVFGASFSNHTGIASYKPTIQVDYDPMALGRFHSVDVAVQGHVGVTAAALLDACPAAPNTHDQRDELAQRWQIWRAEKESRALDRTADGLSAAAVFAALSRHVEPDAVICVDVGNNTYSFGRYFESSGQDVLMSGYLGSIGFGFAAAMGAWAAAPQRQIVSVSGDGGFGQYLAELTTAVKYEMDITHLLLNNSSLAKISKEQRDAGHEVWQTDLHNPDFAAYAELCGAKGARVDDPGRLDDAIAQALAHEGPALVEVLQDPALI
ncbi:MAG TPA: pyruvate oxidase [Acidimicrobiaceae bacterium]|nr:pyruvate oxidase [Acidimicrobiaceae bacterium]HCB36869.1 pyruvate oxidase [Acidimicrobiaceae bacterium]